MDEKKVLENSTASSTIDVFLFFFCFVSTALPLSPLAVVGSSADITRFEGGGVESLTTEQEDDNNKNDSVAAAAASLVFCTACSDSPSFFREVLFFNVTFLLVAIFFDFLVLSDAATFLVMDM